MSYIERERQRGEALQQEQLDWLHNQHEALLEQNQLLRQQNDTLNRIHSHTQLFYVLAIIWLVLTGLALLGYLVAAASS